MKELKNMAKIRAINFCWSIHEDGKSKIKTEIFGIISSDDDNIWTC